MNELALLLTAGRMSHSHRNIIAASYANFLKRQRLASETACDQFRADEASCAFCSRWYDGRPEYRETEDDGACVYAKVVGKNVAKCTPMRRIRDIKKPKVTVMCDGDTQAERIASVLLGQKMALLRALKLFMISSSFHSTNLGQPTGVVRRKALPQETYYRPFKALVVLFLHGGADSFNLLVS